MQIDLILKGREFIGIDSNQINNPFLDAFLAYKFFKKSYTQFNSQISAVRHKLIAHNIKIDIFINLTECKYVL